jgi:hypothetical protein
MARTLLSKQCAASQRNWIEILERREACRARWSIEHFQKEIDAAARLTANLKGRRCEEYSALEWASVKAQTAAIRRLKSARSKLHELMKLPHIKAMIETETTKEIA